MVVYAGQLCYTISFLLFSNCMKLSGCYSSLTLAQVYLYSRSVCSNYGVSFSCGHSGHHSEEVSQLAVLNLLLPEPIHHVPLAGNFPGVWRYCSFCGLSSKIYRLLQRITKTKNRIDAVMLNKC